MQTISVIIPVYREMNIIGQTLSALDAALAGQGAEVIVADGDPAGSTIETLARPDIRTIVAPKGRGPQMSAGAAAATGSILLFLHADTRLPAGAADLIRSAAAKPGISGGAFSLGIRNDRQIYRWIETVATLRTRISRIPYGDQAIFIKRSVFYDLGGYAPIAIMEDIELMRRLKRANKRIRLLPQRVETSSRRWETEGPVFCTLRNTLLSWLYYAGVPAKKLVSFYP